MSSTAKLEASQLSVLLDLRNPFSYLALEPARDFGIEVGTEVNWLPSTVPPLRPPTEPQPEDDRGVRHRRSRAQAIAREIETYSQVQGLVLCDYYRDGDVAPAYEGWLWMREQHPAQLYDYLEALFRGYWALELDAGDPSVIVELVASLGCDADAFGNWSRTEGSAALSGLSEELQERGLFSVPAYVLGDEVFYGRQHLPMIRWLLQGRRGRVPI